MNSSKTFITSIFSTTCDNIKLNLISYPETRNLLSCIRFFGSKLKMAISEISSFKSFRGHQKIFSHDSKELGCKMKFAIYLPDQSEDQKLPVIYWLSGLECNETNFIMKAGAQKYASKQGVILVCPDTSPRGCNLPGETDSWDLGEGASFYVNATQEPWNKHYRMFNYITSELISVINENFPTLEGEQSIMGHSMGGHGALICALKNPGLYKSVSAFAPICNPSTVPWGIKAFTNYFGPQKEGNWEEWDATEIIKNYNGKPIEIFIDQGSADKFLNQLCTEHLVTACRDAHLPARITFREGYDHSYYFIATYIKEHISYHMQHLKF